MDELIQELRKTKSVFVGKRNVADFVLECVRRNLNISGGAMMADHKGNFSGQWFYL